MDALDLVSPFRGDGESVLGLDFPYRLDFVAFRIDFDVTRLQRAGEGAG
jgi:hypothetical protein